MIPTRTKSIKSDPGPYFCVSNRCRQARHYTYTLTQSTTGTDEETSTNGTANGNHLDKAQTIFLLPVLADIASDLLSTAGVVARKATGGLLIGLNLAMAMYFAAFWGIQTGNKNGNDGEKWGRFMKEMPVQSTGTGAQGLRVLAELEKEGEMRVQGRSSIKLVYPTLPPSRRATDADLGKDRIWQAILAATPVTCDLAFGRASIPKPSPLLSLLRRYSSDEVPAFRHGYKPIFGRRKGKPGFGRDPVASDRGGDENHSNGMSPCSPPKPESPQIAWAPLANGSEKVAAPSIVHCALPPQRYLRIQSDPPPLEPWRARIFGPGSVQYTTVSAAIRSLCLPGTLENKILQGCSGFCYTSRHGIHGNWLFPNFPFKSLGCQEGGGGGADLGRPRFYNHPGPPRRAHDRGAGNGLGRCGGWGGGGGEGGGGGGLILAAPGFTIILSPDVSDLDASTLAYLLHWQRYRMMAYTRNVIASFRMKKSCSKGIRPAGSALRFVSIADSWNGEVLLPYAAAPGVPIPPCRTRQLRVVAGLVIM
ncbi:hypothetical protein CCUS01_01011 [Colletotrichum cuscutae]|uniref:Uncharacterized protein n=1 Tax=Colletotrichum cuscutae TaxID=1209917 RepID=A0AAI9Y0A4_9PEZI|nr:hypothetical protein CCUS01_01011 [Colletotrichum cuscutae]